MPHEQIVWLARLVPALVIALGVAGIYVFYLRRGEVSRPGGQGTRSTDREGNAVHGARRVALTALLIAAGVFTFIALVFTFTVA